MNPPEAGKRRWTQIGGFAAGVAPSARTRVAAVPAANAPEAHKPTPLAGERRRGRRGGEHRDCHARLGSGRSQGGSQ